jgi:DNA-binding XRE family transcriptional regulator
MFSERKLTEALKKLIGEEPRQDIIKFGIAMLREPNDANILLLAQTLSLDQDLVRNLAWSSHEGSHQTEQRIEKAELKKLDEQQARSAFSEALFRFDPTQRKALVAVIRSAKKLDLQSNTPRVVGRLLGLAYQEGRTRLGLSRAELAERAGTTETPITNIEEWAYLHEKIPARAPLAVVGAILFSGKTSIPSILSWLLTATTEDLSLHKRACSIVQEGAERLKNLRPTNFPSHFTSER